MDPLPTFRMFPEVSYAHGPGEDRHAFIANCSFVNDTGRPCGEARPMLTNGGLCWTINSEGMADIFTGGEHDDSSMNALQENFDPLLLKAGDRGVFKIPGHGKDFMFKLFLVAQSNEYVFCFTV